LKSSHSVNKKVNISLIIHSLRLLIACCYKQQVIVYKAKKVKTREYYFVFGTWQQD